MEKKRYHFLYLDRKTDEILFYRINDVDQTQEKITKSILQYNKNNESKNMVFQVTKEANPRLVEFMDFVEKMKEEETADTDLSDIKIRLDNIISECQDIGYEVDYFIKNVKGD